MTTTWCVPLCGLNSLVIYFDVKTHDIWDKKHDNEGDLNWEHPVLRVSGYKRRSDIKEVHITEFRVYKYPIQKSIRTTPTPAYTLVVGNHDLIIKFWAYLPAHDQHRRWCGHPWRHASQTWWTPAQLRVARRASPPPPTRPAPQAESPTCILWCSDPESLQQQQQ